MKHSRKSNTKSKINNMVAIAILLALLWDAIDYNAGSGKGFLD